LTTLKTPDVNKQIHRRRKLSF